MTQNKQTQVWERYNGLTLAYMGDGVYELYIRKHVLNKGLTKPNHLHRAATSFVSASAQCTIMQAMLATDDFLSEEELAMYRRGRNSQSHSIAKNADIATYRIATGFEALIGYLYLSGQQDRLDQLVERSIATIEEMEDD